MLSNKYIQSLQAISEADRIPLIVRELNKFLNEKEALKLIRILSRSLNMYSFHLGQYIRMQLRIAQKLVHCFI